MRKIFAVGVFFEVALLIIGLTWIRPHDVKVPATGEVAAGPGTEFRTYGDGSGNVVEVNLVAEEVVQRIAEDVDYHVWTFNGTAPAPVIRVTEGDTVRFTLTNASDQGLSHSIDFHAAQTPWDKNYQPVAPGETASFDFVARFPGVFLYHCGVPPVLMHIANGMYGVIIVEPKDPLPPAREYVLVSSEFYPGPKPVHGVLEGSLDAMNSADPTYVVFNGVANQYLDAPLVAKPDELIRLWVVNAGPTLTNAFHVIGGLFDHVYPDGNPTNALNGVQTYNVPPGGATMFEMKIPDEGLYPFVTHAFAYTGLGSVGLIKIDVGAPDAPTSYPLMGDPFSGGVDEATAPEEPTANGGATGGGTTASGNGGGGGTSASGEMVMIDASISGFTPSDIKVKAGAVDIMLANADTFPHDFTIDAIGLKIPLDASGTAEKQVDLKPGTYEFYCSIPGHKEAGMVGTMTVK